MPREAPVTRATLPVSVLVIGFLRRSNSDDVRSESGGADPAGVSYPISRRDDRSSLERCHGRPDRRGFRCRLADREPAGFILDRAAAVCDAALHRGSTILSQAPWPADASD